MVKSYGWPHIRLFFFVYRNNNILDISFQNVFYNGNSSFNGDHSSFFNFYLIYSICLAFHFDPLHLLSLFLLSCFISTPAFLSLKKKNLLFLNHYRSISPIYINICFKCRCLRLFIFLSSQQRQIVFEFLFLFIFFKYS